MEYEVGRVIHSSITRFAVGCRILPHGVPVFGSLVRTSPQGPNEVFGLIYDIRLEEDPLMRQMATMEDLSPEVVADQRQARQLPIRLEALSVGYRRHGRIYHSLPPQPPLNLDALYVCSPAELAAFTESFGYFRLILGSRGLPVDELLASHLRYAAEAWDTGRSDFLLDAGRELVRLMVADLPRLDALLRSTSQIWVSEVQGG